MISLKAFHKKDVKRVAFKNDFLEYSCLMEQLSKMFNIQATLITYVDECGDKITVTTSEELDEAVRVMSKESRVITFKVHAKGEENKNKRKVPDSMQVVMVSPDATTPQAQEVKSKHRKTGKLIPPELQAPLARLNQPNTEVMEVSPVHSFANRMLSISPEEYTNPDIVAYRHQQETISWLDLKRIYDWYWYPGSGLLAFYYVRPGDQGETFKSKKDMLARGQLGKDYFLSEMDAVDYFLKHYSHLLEEKRISESSDIEVK